MNTIINFLVECRPLSVSMGNAIKFIKLKLSKVRELLMSSGLDDSSRDLDFRDSATLVAPTNTFCIGHYISHLTPPQIDPSKPEAEAKSDLIQVMPTTAHQPADSLAAPKTSYTVVEYFAQYTYT